MCACCHATFDLPGQIQMVACLAEPGIPQCSSHPELLHGQRHCTSLLFVQLAHLNGLCASPPTLILFQALQTSKQLLHQTLMKHLWVQLANPLNFVRNSSIFRSFEHSCPTGNQNSVVFDVQAPVKLRHIGLVLGKIRKSVTQGDCRALIAVVD